MHIWGFYLFFCMFKIILNKTFRIRETECGWEQAPERPLPPPTPGIPVTAAQTRDCLSTHLVLFQSAFLFHVGAIFPSDNGLDVCNRNWSMKGISFWELHGASWSLLRCSKGSLPQTHRAVSAQGEYLVLFPLWGRCPWTMACRAVSNLTGLLDHFPKAWGLWYSPYCHVTVMMVTKPP